MKKNRKRAVTSSTKSTDRHMRRNELKKTERVVALLMLLLQHNLDKLLDHHRSQ